MPPRHHWSICFHFTCTVCDSVQRDDHISRQKLSFLLEQIIRCHVLQISLAFCLVAAEKSQFWLYSLRCCSTRGQPFRRNVRLPVEANDQTCRVLHRFSRHSVLGIAAGKEVYVSTLLRLTLSLPRAINFKFLLEPHQYWCYITQ